MSLRKIRNSTFKLFKDGMGRFIDPNHFLGQTSMEGEHQIVVKGELKHQQGKAKDK